MTVKNMTRWKITIEYDGGPFFGWQMQESEPSVQQALEDAIRAFSGEDARVHAAGRTDAGVHALGQVAHFDLEKETDARTVREATNAHLRPRPVAVLRAEIVDREFHSRFSAKKRHYLYRILQRKAPPVLDAGRVWHVPLPLDVGAMQKAANYLIGTHDFTSFRAKECQSDSPVKSLDQLDIIAAPPGHPDEIHILASARSFLHHQIRNITGTLKMVGEGKWSPQDVKKALEARDRSAAGPTAPAHGLYFVKVDY